MKNRQSSIWLGQILVVMLLWAACISLTVSSLEDSPHLHLGAVVTEATSDITWVGAFIVSLLSLSLAGTALAYWLWCKVLETAVSYPTNVFTYLVPVLGSMIGAFFYDEPFGFIKVFGVLLSLAARSLVNLKPGCLGI